MPDTPTPGHVARAAFWRFLAPEDGDARVALESFDARSPAAWEAAAQAVQSDVRRYVRAVIRHWHACGPGDGFAEHMHALETWLEAQPPQEDTPHA